MKKLITIAFIGLLLGACATTSCPLPTVTEIPVTVQIKPVQVPECPLLPIFTIPADAGFDMHLKAWDASIILLQGCVKARDQVIQSINSQETGK